MTANARRLLLTLLYRSGAFRLWRLWHRNALIILTVHGVVDDGREQAWRPLRPRLSLRQLERTLRLLREHYRIISMADAAAMLGGSQALRARSVVLTFDDGYRTQVADVAPLLAAHDAAATVFVSTGHVVTRRPFWFDRLDYAIQHSTMESGPVTAGGQEVEFSGGTAADRAGFFGAVRRLAKQAPRDDREMGRELEALATRFEAAGGRRLADVLEADPLSAPLTPGEIQAAPDAFTFGSHTIDHLRVNRLPEPVAFEQLTGSKIALEGWTGKPCRFFCYPDGGVNARAAALVRQAGFEAAVTTERGLNRVGDDLMTLRRIDIPLSGTDAEIVAQISGFADWLACRRRTVRANGRWRR